jgi:hypothetical protein
MAVGLVALVSIAYFDFATTLPANDDWQYSWSARHLAAGGGLKVYPEQGAPALPQILLGAAVWRAIPDQRALRLLGVPMIAVTLLLIYATARRLGAEHGWAGAASLALVVDPIYASTVTSFMTEAMFLCLIALGCFAIVSWLRDGRRAWLIPIVVGLASLQRQAGVVVALALAVAVVAGRMSNQRRTGGFLMLAATIATGVLAIVGPGALWHFYGLDGVHRNPLLVAAAFDYLPAMFGVALIPLAVALVATVWRQRRWRWWPVVLGVALGWCIISALSSFIFPGNYLNAAGLGRVTMPGTKPGLFLAVIPTLSVAAMLSFIAAAIAISARWGLSRLDPAVLFLVVFGVLVTATAGPAGTADRYFLPAVVAFLPVVAWAGSSVRMSREAAIAGALTALAMISLYIVGEQDYQAWQAARETIVEQIYRLLPADRVDAGYEVYAVRVLIPNYERTGMFPVPLAQLPSGGGISNPDVGLFMALPSDPRPGISYRSLAPGRIVAVCIRRSLCDELGGR